MEGIHERRGRLRTKISGAQTPPGKRGAAEERLGEKVEGVVGGGTRSGWIGEKNTARGVAEIPQNRKR